MTVQTKDNLLILGAGQYGQVAKEIAQSMDCFDKIDFLDDNNQIAIGKIEDYKKFSSAYSYYVVAVGNADIRLKYINEIEKSGFRIATLISPKAYVSSSAQIDYGSIVEPFAVANAHSVIGKAVLVCVGAIVNHNATIEDACQLDCGSVVESNAVMPSKTKLSSNKVFGREGIVLDKR